MTISLSSLTSTAASAFSSVVAQNVSKDLAQKGDFLILRTGPSIVVMGCGWAQGTEGFG